ncbi:MAG: acyloxyacyl hydrolase [Paludibacteraceae bacterium]|nr:acyloxyacyl hydrolase [Paludibacteraceae bacterium]
MRKYLSCILFFACLQAFALPHYELAYTWNASAGIMMPDGKVEEWIGSRPLLGGSFNVEFLPTGRWHSLQQWNNASVGVGLRYLNLGNDDKLGSAIAAYGYINEPFYNGKHFRIGLRPVVGIAACTKTYRNTFEGEKLYNGHKGANWSIGSVLNAYLSVQLFMDFPIKKGWEITTDIGWHHISNGSILHPNAGYNMFLGSLGLRYHPEEQRGKGTLYEAPKPDVPRKLYEDVDKPWAIEISATGGIRQTYYSDNANGLLFFGAASMKVAAYWVPIGIFRLGAGFDGFYDGYYQCVYHRLAKPDNTAPITYFGKTYLYESNIANCFRVGFSIQPEFIIGKLTAGLHVGFYLYDPIKNLEPFDWNSDPTSKDYDPNALHPGDKPLNRGIFYSYDFTKASNYQDGWCYMQFVLKYHVLDHLFVQLGLKTHGVRAEFIDAGIGVAF